VSSSDPNSYLNNTNDQEFVLYKSVQDMINKLTKNWNSFIGYYGNTFVYNSLIPGGGVYISWSGGTAMNTLSPGLTSAYPVQATTANNITASTWYITMGFYIVTTVGGQFGMTISGSPYAYIPLQTTGNNFYQITAGFTHTAWNATTSIDTFFNVPGGSSNFQPLYYTNQLTIYP
jgi:hypothetical protein